MTLRRVARDMAQGVPLAADAGGIGMALGIEGSEAEDAGIVGVLGVVGVGDCTVGAGGGMSSGAGAFLQATSAEAAMRVVAMSERVRMEAPVESAVPHDNISKLPAKPCVAR